MSWQLASFLILGGVLLGGFAWYERSRPPSQVVALVAALAALAIAGRIAFAAFPNVKPTTDIVVFAGYALGAAPGFAVGALAALVSNFWFGQGPWTPWQMAGWGLCGMLGAALALGVRNAGRFTLAAACGLAGIAYGALLNFSLDGDLRRRPLAGALPGAGGPRRALRRCPRARQRRLRPGRRPGDGADAGPLPRALRVAAPPAVATARRCVALLSCRRCCPVGPAAGRHWPRRQLARLGPERRRRLRLLARGRLQRRDHRLGDAGPGGRRSQPPRRRPRRPHAGRLPALATSTKSSSAGDLARTILALEAPASTRAPSAAATSSPSCCERRPPTAPTRAGRARPPSASIALRAAGATGGLDKTSPGWPRCRTTTAAGATCRASPATPTGPAR